jgi:hypothetical protein
VACEYLSNKYEVVRRRAMIGILMRRFLLPGSLLLLCVNFVWAIPFGGIEFPDGVRSFADAILRVDPLFSGGPAATDDNDPLTALGPPDNVPGFGQSSALGRGGLIELLFVDNRLTNSGDAALDLHIFEVGPDVEDTFVAIRPTSATLLLLDPAGDTDGDGFFAIGKVLGATSSIDIDSIFPGFAAGALSFDAVQLIDDPNEGDMTGVTVGADIDAVGAISSSAAPVPEPSTWLLCGTGLIGLLLYGWRKRSETA